MAAHWSQCRAVFRGKAVHGGRQLPAFDPDTAAPERRGLASNLRLGFSLRVRRRVEVILGWPMTAGASTPLGGADERVVRTAVISNGWRGVS